MQMLLTRLDSKDTPTTLILFAEFETNQYLVAKY